MRSGRGRIVVGLAAVLAILILCAVVSQKRVQGVFTYGFEVMAFQPCGSSERWWVAEGSQDILHFHGEPPAPAPGQHFVSLYVEVGGRVNSRGHYGHLGAYPRSLTVKKVLAVSGTVPRTCK